MPLLHPTVQQFQDEDARGMLATIHLPQFTVSQRMVHYLADSECCRPLPDMKIHPMRPPVAPPPEDNQLKSIGEAFCFRFGASPSLSLEGHASLAVGVPSATAYTYAAPRSEGGYLEPFSPYALATARSNHGVWTGQWRRWSCVCEVCAGCEDGECAQRSGGWYPWSIRTQLEAKGKLLASLVGLRIASSPVWSMDANDALSDATDALMGNIADHLINGLGVWSSLQLRWRAVKLVKENFRAGVWLKVWAAIRRRASGVSFDVEAEQTAMTDRLVKAKWGAHATAKARVSAALRA